jgi:HlyD family secretion protein
VTRPPGPLPSAPAPAPADARAGETAIEFLPDADEIERRPLPPAARMTLYVLTAMVFSFLLWASISEVDRIVVARGRLVTPLPNIVVQPLETSIVQSIDVRVGQVVKKGEKIATLDPTFTSADLAQLQARHQSLDTQAKRLEMELAGGKPVAGAGNADGRLQAQLAVEKQSNYRSQLAKMTETVERLKAVQLTNKRDKEVLDARVPA